MDLTIIEKLRALAYQYCNEENNQYLGGQTIKTWKLNTLNYEKLSGFVNWIEATQTPQPKPKRNK